MITNHLSNLNQYPIRPYPHKTEFKIFHLNQKDYLLPLHITNIHSSSTNPKQIHSILQPHKNHPFHTQSTTSNPIPFQNNQDSKIHSKPTFAPLTTPYTQNLPFLCCQFPVQLSRILNFNDIFSYLKKLIIWNKTQVSQQASYTLFPMVLGANGTSSSDTPSTAPALYFSHFK